MSMLKFAEDFTHLISRYTRYSSPNNDPSNAPLTDQEIVYTIRHVLHVLMEDSNIMNATNLVETSDSVIAAQEISVAETKIEPNVEDTYRSQATQPVVTDAAISDISLCVVKKEREDSFTLQNEKKFMSRSNPAICVTCISRSDTFVREENQKVKTENQEDDFEDFINTETNDLSRDLSLSVSLNEIRKSAMDIMATLNNIKSSFLQSRKVPKRDKAKVQQSPGRSSFRRTSTMNRTKVPTNIGKSSISGSQTSSKLVAIETGNISERRKSTGGIGTSAATAGKFGKSTKVGHSSNLNLSACNKGSPGPSLEYQPKFTKNPKYAHVQSTIPKIIQKKKGLHLQKTTEVFI